MPSNDNVAEQINCIGVENTLNDSNLSNLQKLCLSSNMNSKSETSPHSETKVESETITATDAINKLKNCDPDNEDNSKNNSKVIVLPQANFGSISCLMKGKSVFSSDYFCKTSYKNYSPPQFACHTVKSKVSDSAWEEESIGNSSGDASDRENCDSFDFPEMPEKEGKENQKDVSSIKQNKISDWKNGPYQCFTGDFPIYPGKGKQLGDIKYIASRIMNAGHNEVRTIHYILFGKYGIWCKGDQRNLVIQNILHFSGFLFEKEDDVYSIKKAKLNNLPLPLLTNVAEIILNSQVFGKNNIINSLLDFFMNPSDKYVVEEPDEVMIPNPNDLLKKEALETFPVIKLQKLDEKYIEEMTKKIYSKETNDTALQSQNGYENHGSSASSSNQMKLKNFPHIVTNIQKARRRIINILHIIMYGRPGSTDYNRRNILNFEKFKVGVNTMKKMSYLKGCSSEELIRLCEVFGIRAKSGTKDRKIKKIISFLTNPRLYTDSKLKFWKQTKRKEQTLPNTLKRQDNTVINKDKGGLQNFNRISETSDITAANKSKVRLRDFDRIRSNIECTPPDNLTELHHLLYFKNCDTSDIHEKILDFSSYDSNATELNFRNTLLTYMSIKTVQQIAQLLNIQDWKNYICVRDLGTSIVNFLRDMKLPDKKVRLHTGPKSKRKQQKSHFLQGIKNRDKCESSDSEQFDSNYGSEEILEHKYKEYSSSNYYEKTSRPRFRRHKNGLSSKHTQILNDSTLLLDVMQHPTESELQVQIDRLMAKTSLNISMGDFIKKVLKCYPRHDLTYRIEFIKNKTLQMVQELQQNVTVFSD